LFPGQESAACEKARVEDSEGDGVKVGLVGVKVHVVGGPGSGKTTLARKVAARLRVNPVDLDRIAFDRSEQPFALLGAVVGGQRTTQARRALAVETILQAPAWLTEGIYVGWTASLMAEADIVVWLDPPTRVALWRIVTRHAKASWHGTNEFKGLRLLARFLRSSYHYYVGPSDVPEEVMTLDEEAITRTATGALLRRYAARVRHCRTDGDCRSLLRSLPPVAV
jgi:adenylate kinase family enzyme